jgi:hypothetical protein
VSNPRTPRASEVATCGGCTRTWTALSAAHCSACHTHPFSSVRLFDLHRSSAGDHGRCLNPAQIHNRAGERVMFLRDGMWRGPEMTDEEKARVEGRIRIR